MNKRYTITVYGRVHGVGFRYEAQDRARGLGLSGFVRNQDDGSVEIVAEGEKAPLDELLAWARRGPETARVKEITCEVEEATSEFSEFSVR